MLKRIIALISSITIFASLFTSIPVNAEEENEFTLTYKQKLLLALDIISLNSYGTFDNDAEMTRADFAAVCGKILDINPSSTADCMYFTDVTPDSWFAYTVNQLTVLGVISEAEDKLFNPDRSVSLNEAIKMLTCLMGYNTYAQINGGYPEGYLKVASQQNLLDGVSNNSVFTKGMMCELVYNALHANVMLTDYAATGQTLSIDDNETMLSYYQDTYDDKGILEAAYGVSITGTMAGENGVIINGTNFFVGDIENIQDYLGYQLKLYYRVDDNNEYTLRYIEPYKTNELTVYSDDFISFSGLGGRLEYDDGSKIKYADIKSNAVVIKNGSNVASGIEDAFDISNGEIRLIDNNDDGDFEIVVIYDFQTIVVNTYNKETSVIIDKLDPKRIIDLKDISYITVLSDSGEKLDLSAITKNAVIDVAMSINHAIIYVNSDSINGEITSIRESDQEMGIDGVKYKFLNEAYFYYNLSLGNSGLFKTNKYNKIAYYDASGVTGNPGYVLKSAYTDELCENLMMKILNTEGNISWINVSSDVKVDGDKISSPSLEMFQNFNNSVIIYELNSNNEISKIDSTMRGSKEDNTSLKKTMSLNDIGHRWMKNSNMFDRTVIVDDNATIFKVPPVSSSSREEKAFSVASLSDFVSNRMYQVEAYQTGNGSYSTIIVWYERMYYQNYRDQLIFVEKVERAVNAKGEEVYNIEGWQKGSKVNVELVYPHEIVPKRGDCIRIGVDKDNMAGLVEIHYDFQRDGSGYSDKEADWHWNDVDGEPYDAINNYWNGTFNDLQGDFRLGFGYAVGIEDTLVKWSFKKDSNVVGEMVPIDASVPVVVYDVKRDVFREGSIEDIMTMESYGSNCSTLIANFSWGEVTELFVINNRY